MTKRDHEPELRILASTATASRITRRHFLMGSAAAMFSGGVVLASCSSDGGTGSSSGATATGSSLAALESDLNFYNWAEYDEPKVVKRFTSEYGPATTLDTYNSNEEMIAKLLAAGGTTGYDIVVPTGIYIPEMVSKDLLMELDLSRIPNFANLDPQFQNQPWDPGNKHSVCKDSGSVGWLVDTSKVKADIQTWNDFNTAAMTEASGQTSLLDSAPEVPAVYFWANGIEYATEDPAQLDAAEHFIVDELAPHIKAFDTAPDALGTYALSQAFSGTARVALITAENPNVKWHLGAPATEIWMDNWCILKTAAHPNAAYAWINYIYDPENAYEDMLYHGTNPGIKGVEEKAKQGDMQFPENVFFTPEQLATMQDGAINSAQQRQVDILAKAKAAAAGA